MKYALVLFAALAVGAGVCAGSFYAGKSYAEFDCARVCDPDRSSMAGYLTCKSVCHDMAVANVVCVFKAMAPQWWEQRGTEEDLEDTM